MASSNSHEGIEDPRQTPCLARAAMSIAWPSFLAATALTGLFFSLFDPHDLLLLGEHIELGRRESYGLGFMVFWAFSALASAMTYVLARPTQSVPKP
ncbi:MAG: hypothetical protein RLZZ344_842 [Pseudomonadota bacterium]|jgi:cytosine/uracil/thiamine/allantoin permease